MKTQAARFAHLMLAASLLACGNEPADPNDPSNPGAPALANFQQSACKVAGTDPVHFGSGAGGSLEAQVKGNDVVVLHKDASYNCAHRLSMEATFSANEILVKEVIANPNDTLARCMCPFDLSAEVKGLAAGTYLLKVLDAEGTLIGSTTVTLGASAQSLEHVESMQSACKGSAAEYEASEAAKASPEADLLRIVHEDARYNCAAKVKMEATLVGDEIIVKEIITNPGEQAFCVCDFDLSVGLKGLSPGTYTVKIFDADGNLVSSTQVTIA